MRISDRAHVYKKTRTRIKYGRKKAALKIIWEVCFEKKMADRGAFDAAGAVFQEARDFNRGAGRLSPGQSNCAADAVPERSGDV